MKLYAEFSKAEKQDDGTLMVYGYASSESVDAAKEIITAEAMKAALPDYMKFANIREMHQLSAVGTAIEANVEADGRTYLAAHVIDPVAVKKVETGVYKGFSVGGKVTSRDDVKKNTITGITLNEISLVDRPCNPDATFSLFKADMDPVEAVDTLAKLMDAGTVSPAHLLELIKADMVGVPKTAAIDGQKPDEVKKGMWTLQDFAGILSCLSNMALGAQDEASWEGDDSPIPAQLREWVTTGVKIFQAMTIEESNELLASMKVNEPPAVEVIIAADKGGDLAKVTDDLTKAAETLAKTTADLAKVTSERDAAIAERDSVAKTIGEALGAKEGEIVTDVAKALVEERDGLAKSYAALRAMPQPGKAFLKAIGKAADLGNANEQQEVAKVRDSAGNENDIATLIKAVHANGPESINL